MQKLNSNIIQLAFLLLLNEFLFVIGQPYLAVGCSKENAKDSILQVWDLNVGGILSLSFTDLHNLSINALQIIDYTTLASGSDDGTMKIWNITTGSNLSTKDLGSPVRSLKLLPNRYFACALENGIIFLLDEYFDYFSELGNHLNKTNALELLENGDLASGSDDGFIKIWNTKSFAIKYTLNAGFPVNCLKRLPNNRLASGLNGSNQLVIWDMTNYTVLKNLTYSDKINALEYWGDELLASGSEDKNITIWHITAGSVYKTLTAHTSAVNTLKIMPDGRLASGSSDKIVYFWNKLSFTFNDYYRVNCKILAVEILEESTQKSSTPVSTTTSTTNKNTTIKKAFSIMATSSTSFNKINNSPNKMAVGCSTIYQGGPLLQLWDLSSYTRVNLVFTDLHTANITSLKSIDNTKFASGSDDGAIKIWNIENGTCLLTLNMANSVRSLELLPNGYLASGLANGSIVLLNTFDSFKTFKIVGNHSKKINALELLENGNFASGSDDGFINIWDAFTYELNNTINAGYPVNCLKRLPNNRLATGLSGSNQIVIWNLINFSVIYYIPQSSRINALEYWGDELLACGSANNNILIWNLTESSLHKTFTSHAFAVNTLRVLPDGNLTSGSSDRYVRIWNKESSTQIKDLIIDCQVLATVLLGASPLAQTNPTTITSTNAPTTTFRSITTETEKGSTISTIQTTTQITTVSEKATPLIESTSKQVSTSFESTGLSLTTTTLSTPVKSSLQNLLNNLNNSFSLNQLPISDIMLLLDSNYSLSNCIVNCTNHGLCKYVSLDNKFICLCNSAYFSGVACQRDTRPCSSNPCMHGSTCIDESNSLFQNLTNKYNRTYICMCPQYYDGPNCELKLDLCQNETCSNNGNCVDNKNSVSCECYYLYEGSKCSSQSTELKTIKIVTLNSLIVAIIIIVSTYLFFSWFDITKFCFQKRTLNSSKKANSKKKKKMKTGNKVKDLIAKSLR